MRSFGNYNEIDAALSESFATAISMQLEEAEAELKERLTKVIHSRLLDYFAAKQMVPRMLLIPGDTEQKHAERITHLIMQELVS